MSESNLLRKIMKAVSGNGVKIFRNNTGKAWIGKSRRISVSGNYYLTNGDVVVSNARFFEAGLCVGSSDLIGWKSIIITPEMVGRTVAIFAGLEVKEGAGRASVEQKQFVAVLRQSGGIGAIVHSVEEAINSLAAV